MKIDADARRLLEERIRTIPDFPKEGIRFKDITPLLADPKAFRLLVKAMADLLRANDVQSVLSIEARGFILGAVIAHELELPFVPARKPGKLPFDTVKVEYELEYGSATLEVHADAFMPGARVAIVDDVLATGGSALAAATLAEQLGAKVAGCFFAIELGALGGRARLGPRMTQAVLEL